MKYEIDLASATIASDNKEALRKILDGDIYDVINYSEACGLMEEDEAREAFAGLHARAERLEDGSIEVKIPILVRGEPELEEDVDEDDEPFYYLAEYEEVDRTEFDEKSMELFHELGF